MIEIIGIALAILALLYVGYPLWQKPLGKVSFALNHGAEDLLARKTEIYAAIRDIDFDYRMGKLSEEDYNSLREQYKGEAISIMKQLDRLTIVSSRRTKSGTKPDGAKRYCHHCGQPLEARDRFCSSCGESLA